MAIYIPKRINVGYNNRSDTYTGKLAYVIYYDEKGKLRKEASWQSWRNKNIPNTEYDNVPTEGFVLNKKVGDYSTGWDHRKSYCRVYDPRGFEFEITIENLLYILQNTTSTVGKGLEGDFVYGWDGKDLILIPTCSPDYQSIIKYSSIVNDNNHIKVKDLKIGATYLDKNNDKYIYMGKFDRWNYCYKKNGKLFEYMDQMENYCKKNNIKPDEIIKGYYSWDREKEVWNPDEEGQMPFEKCHVFYKENESNRNGSFLWVKSLGNKFISCIDDNCREDYADLFDKLECTINYSPIDNSKDNIIYYSFDEFRNYVNKNVSGWRSVSVYTNNERVNINSKDNGYILYKDEDALKYGFAIGKEKYGFAIGKEYQWSTVRSMLPVTLEEIFKRIKPYYKEVYLANGRLLKREGI